MYDILTYWHMTFDIWYRISDIEHSIWYMTYDIWHMIYDTWHMPYDNDMWCMMIIIVWYLYCICMVNAAFANPPFRELHPTFPVLKGKLAKPQFQDGLLWEILIQTWAICNRNHALLLTSNSSKVLILIPGVPLKNQQPSASKPGDFEPNFLESTSSPFNPHDMAITKAQPIPLRAAKSAVMPGSIGSLLGKKHAVKSPTSWSINCRSQSLTVHWLFLTWQGLVERCFIAWDKDELHALSLYEAVHAEVRRKCCRGITKTKSSMEHSSK